jgi:hypothetical protein
LKVGFLILLGGREPVIGLPPITTLPYPFLLP